MILTSKIVTDKEFVLLKSLNILPETANNQSANSEDMYIKNKNNSLK